MKMQLPFTNDNFQANTYFHAQQAASPVNILISLLHAYTDASTSQIP